MRFDALISLPYRRFWLGSMASIGSTQLCFIAMAWLVFELSGSPLHLGFLGAAMALPTIAATLVGGIVADRLNRRSILLVTTTVAAVLFLLLAALDVADMVRVWHVLVVSGLFGLVQGFDMPARSSIFPALIQPHQMLSAVALNSILWQGTRMILPAIGGILIALTDTALVSCFRTRFLDNDVGTTLHPDPADFCRGRKALARVCKGRKVCVSTSAFRVLIVLTFSLHFFGTSYIQIMPVFADLLQSGERGYGLLISVTGVGSVIGTRPDWAISAVPKTGAGDAVLSRAVAVCLVWICPGDRRCSKRTRRVWSCQFFCDVVGRTQLYLPGQFHDGVTTQCAG